MNFIKRDHLLKLTTLLLALMLILVGCGGTGQVADSNDDASSDSSADDQQQEQIDEIEIRLAHAAPTDDTRHLGAERIKEYLEEESDGKITVTIYPAGQLGGGTDEVEAAQAGALEMSIFPTSFLGSFQPLFGVLDIPYLFTEDVNEADILNGPAGDALLKTLDDVNLVGLGLWTGSPQHFTANKPLKTLEDFKGLKFRVMPSDLLLHFIESLGANAVTFDYSEVYSALQTGAIDGQESSLESIENMKFYEVQDYISLTSHLISGFLVFGSKEWFDDLSPATQDLITQAVEEASKEFEIKRSEKEAEVREIIEASGTEFIELTPEELQDLREATYEPVKNLFIENNGDEAKQLVEQFETAIEEAR